MPGGRGRRDRSADALVDAKHMALKLATVRGPTNAGSELLSHDDTQILERCPGAVKLLQRLVRGGVAKGVDEELGVQDVLLRREVSGLLLRDVLADVLGEHVVDERLVPDALSARGLPELLEHAGVHADRDQLAWGVPDGGPTHPAHRPELNGRCLRDVTEVNRARRTPYAPGGSPGAR